MNIQGLRAVLTDDREAVLIVSEVNRRYFTEFPASDGVLAVTRNDAVFFTDSRYIEAAGLAVKDCRTALLRRMSEEVAAYLKAQGITRVRTERARLTVDELEALKTALPACRVTACKRLEKAINNLREVKDDTEVKAIVKAQRIAEAALDHVLGNVIKPGVTEREIGLALDYYMLSHGAEALSFETIAVTGKKTSMPHGVPGSLKVKAGDFITMDFGAVWHGYHSDMTRTVAVGKVSREQRKVYETVLAAQTAAREACRPGITGREMDAAARKVIADAGYGDYFGHGLGHGVGVEIHELPGAGPRSETKLRAGNVVTDEPGIYLPGKFGVRIEDMLLVTDGGCRCLTKAPRELIVL